MFFYFLQHCTFEPQIEHLLKLFDLSSDQFRVQVLTLLLVFLPAHTLVEVLGVAFFVDFLGYFKHFLVLEHVEELG